MKYFSKPTVDFTVEGNIVTAYVKPYNTITKTEVDYLAEVLNESKLDDFGFIDVRPASSQISIDPLVYEYAFSKIQNIKAYAVVSDSQFTIDMFNRMEAEFIKHFDPKDLAFSSFSEISKAQDWVRGNL